MVRVSEAIGAFLRARATPANQDLVDRWSIDLETQVNVAADGGEPVDGRRGTYTDGEYQWFNIRIPKNASGDPYFDDYHLSWPLPLHAEGIGMTGWDWRARVSRWCGYDFDAIADHAQGHGITAEELDRVKQAAMALPYVEVRKSTGGGGIHLYIYFDDTGIPTANHTEHAALGRWGLGMMGRDCGFPFGDYVDCCGGNMWVYHRKMTAENEGLKILKPAEKVLTAADIPTNWRDLVPKKPKKKTNPAHSVTSIDDAFNSKSHFEFLTDFGYSAQGGGQFARPGTDKPVSASIVTAQDGTPLLHVFSSNAAPLEKDKNYTATRAYALLKHSGDVDAARNDLVKQGFGQKRFSVLTSKELFSTDYTVNYLIEEVMAEAQPMVTGAPKKGMKTSLLLAQAIALATGKPYLDHFAVPKPVNVVIFSGESGMGTIQQNARHIARAMDVDPDEDLERLFWCDQLPRFDKPEDLDAVDRELEEREAKVLIVDPIYLCLGATNSSDLFAQGALLYPMAQLCQRHGAALVLAHHTRKLPKHRTAADYQPLELDDLTQSGFPEFARQWILLNRRGPYESGTGHHELWITFGGSAGHSSEWALDIEEGTPHKRRWETRLFTLDEARNEKKSDTIREKLIAAMKDFPNGEVKTEIFAKAGKRSDLRTRDVFDTLVMDKVFVPCEITRNGQKHAGYRLAT